jgi:ABC-2 type transport system permease protein
MNTTHPWSWSVRRELWENRYVTLVPIVVAAIALFASVAASYRLPHRMRELPSLDAAHQHLLLVRPFSLAVAVIMFATILAGFFYSFDALHGERRDRSILFWKSLPVSDLTTVLAKASVPLVVLPLVALALSLATFASLLAASTVVLLANGMSPARLLAELHFVQEPLVMAYGLTVHALWFAPVYCWLILVSAWARRAPLLWAVLPVVGAGAVERIAFHTSLVPAFLRSRFLGAMGLAFAHGEPGSAGMIDRLAQLTPGTFLGNGEVWIGLAFSAAFLAATVWLRRERELI